MRYVIRSALLLCYFAQVAIEFLYRFSALDGQSGNHYNVVAVLAVFCFIKNYRWRYTNMRIDRVKFITEMARADLKVYELSERAGVHKNTVVNVKGGKTCSAATAEKLAAGLGVPLSALLEK